MNRVHFDGQIETTNLYLIQHSISLQAKGLFKIDNESFLKVLHTILVFAIGTNFFGTFSACGCCRRLQCGLHSVL